MSEIELSFENFIDTVDPKYRDFARQIDIFMQKNGCKLQLKHAKNGYVVSYQHGKKKRVIMNFVFRKSTLFARVYGDNVGHYTDVLHHLPDKMAKALEKASVCKRFDDPSQCSPKCSGYMFSIGDKQYKKCRYSCFLFAIDEESIPIIRSLLENELKYRDLAAIEEK